MAVAISVDLTMGLFGKKSTKKAVVTALIGDSTHIDSHFLRFAGGIHIHGYVGLDVVGSEDTGTAISLAEDGEVDGDIRAVDIFIAGLCKAMSMRPAISN